MFIKYLNQIIYGTGLRGIFSYHKAYNYFIISERVYFKNHFVKSLMNFLVIICNVVLSKISINNAK